MDEVIVSASSDPTSVSEVGSKHFDQIVEDVKEYYKQKEVFLGFAFG